MTFLSGLWRSFCEAIGMCPTCTGPYDGNGPCGRCGGPYFP